MKKPLYIAGYPGKVGGASTRLLHLAPLLCDDFEITFLPAPHEVGDPEIAQILQSYGVRHAFLDSLPAQLEGVVFVCCQTDYFTSGLGKQMKQRGLSVVWSNDMMWEFPGERNAAAHGLIDKVLFVSEFQKQALGDLYRGLPHAIVGNYICPDFFPFREKIYDGFNIGRLSRADFDKYPEDFPAFYECISPPETHFWVMAWDKLLSHKYRWHDFEERWHLLKAGEMEAADFLRQLDLFVYSLGPVFKESWGRSTVEAMLCGTPPLVPAGHQFERLIVHEESGFICHHVDQYTDYIRQLRDQPSLRARVAHKARRHAETVLCDRAAHRALWRDALNI